MTQERAPERERPQLERSLARLPGRWQKTVSRIPRNRERAGSRRIHSARNRRVLLDLTVVPVSDSSSLFRLAGPLHRTQATLQAAAPRPAPRPPIPRPTAPRRRSCRPCRAVRPCRSSPAQRSATPSGRLRVLAPATLSSSYSGTAPNGTPRTPTASAAPHRRACPSRSCPTASKPDGRMVLAVGALIEVHPCRPGPIAA